MAWPFRSRKLQASRRIEGQNSNMDITNALLFNTNGNSIGGFVNDYLAYSSQVNATYSKYNGKSEWGNAEVRTIVDIRSAFIAGEGLVVTAENEQLAKWITKFLTESKLAGSKFYDAVTGTEMAGQCLLLLTPVAGNLPIVDRVPYTADQYKVNRKSAYSWAPDSISLNVGDDNTVTISGNKFVHVRTGGDDLSFDEPTTKIGIVLTECENYDRALKDIRRTNYTSSRITPTFEVENEQQAAELNDKIKKSGWKIGQAFIGKAKFTYQTAGTGAIDNLKTELASAVKKISAVTGVPVHWLGWTDLMSNRATADDLYHSINNATIRERTLFSEGMKELILKAQTLYIDNGGTELSKVNQDFTVSIPCIDFGRFESMVKALSVAYNDKIISADDYRSFIPGIDPLKTKKALAEVEAQAVKETIDTLDDGVDEDADAEAEAERKAESDKADKASRV